MNADPSSEMGSRPRLTGQSRRRGLTDSRLFRDSIRTGKNPGKAADGPEEKDARHSPLDAEGRRLRNARHRVSSGSCFCGAGKPSLRAEPRFPARGMKYGAPPARERAVLPSRQIALRYPSGSPMNRICDRQSWGRGGLPELRHPPAARRARQGLTPAAYGTKVVPFDVLDHATWLPSPSRTSPNNSWRGSVNRRRRRIEA